MLFYSILYSQRVAQWVEVLGLHGFLLSHEYIRTKCSVNITWLLHVNAWKITMRAVLSVGYYRCVLCTKAFGSFDIELWYSSGKLPNGNTTVSRNCAVTLSAGDKTTFHLLNKTFVCAIFWRVLFPSHYLSLFLSCSFSNFQYIYWFRSTV